jgi:hypothetical protein
MRCGLSAMESDMRFTARGVLFSLILILCSMTAATAGPMRDLARLVPADATSPVLAMPGPVRRALLRFAPKIGADPVAPWVLTTAHPYWSAQYWAEPIQTGGGPAYFGATFDAIEGIAGWGEEPEAAGAMLLRDANDGAAIAGFLGERGYQRREVNGVAVYWLGDRDGTVDLGRRNSDLFVGGMGKASRVALEGAALFAAHGWPQIEVALARGDGLLADGGKAGIVDAVEGADAGVPVQILFTGPQQPRLADPAALLGADPQLAAFNEALSDLPPIPSFNDSALVLWLAEGHLVSGVALFYGTSDGAGAALPWMTALKDSPLAGVGIWSDLLPDATARAVVVGSGSVLFWTVRNDLDPAGGIGALKVAPEAFRALLKLRSVRQLAAVLGG